LSILDQEIYNSIGNLGKNQELIRLEGEFQELKEQALILKKQHNNSEYEKIKEKLKGNIRERKRIYWS
jgi:hypothetical protein